MIHFNPILLFHWLVISLACVVFALVDDKATISAIVFDIYIIALVFSVFFKAKGIGKYFYPSLLIIFTIFSWQFYLYYSKELLNGGEWYAFLRSTRFLFYLLSFIYIGEVVNSNQWGGAVLEFSEYKRFVTRLMALFAIVYLFQMIFIGEYRPKLYSENNYEIPSVLLLILFLLYLDTGSNESKSFPLLGGLLSVLSMSKSGILEAAYVLLMGKNKKVSIKSLVILLASGFFVGAIVLGVFFVRMDGIEIGSLDRVRFLIVFWDLMVDSSFWEIGFGHGAASQLTFSSCMELKYWAAAVSNDYAFCDATVFHSLFLKLAYDFGVMGLMLYLYAWLYFLRRYFGKALGLKLFVVVFVCSLSVSGFSNSIVIWPFFFALVYLRFQSNNSET